MAHWASSGLTASGIRLGSGPAAHAEHRLADALRSARYLAAPFWRHDRVAPWQLGGVVSATQALVWLQYLLIRWREHTTGQLLTLWLASATPYRLDGTLDNPDQRLAEDVRNFAASTLDLSLGLLNACVTLLSFVAILWHLSGTLHVPWPAPGWSWPGYLVWIALAYATIGSVLVRLLGAPLVPANARQQRVEADFRYALVQVRDHAESIALTRGEPAERRRLEELFAAIRINWHRLIGLNKRHDRVMCVIAGRLVEAAAVSRDVTGAMSGVMAVAPVDHAPVLNGPHDAGTEFPAMSELTRKNP